MRIDQYVERILEEVQSSGKERDEMREEILSHLEEAKSYYMNEGMTKQAAEEKAISEFGSSKLIGQNLQESLYPWQRWILYAIGIGMIAFGGLFYLLETFIQHESIPVFWLAVQLLIGGAVTLAVMNISFAGRHAYGLNVILLLSIIWCGINIMLFLSMPSWQLVVFTLYQLIIIGLGFIAIVRNAYDADALAESERPKRGLALVSHIVNLLLGMVVAGFSLFYIWGVLMFSSESFYALAALMPIIIWIACYKFQMLFITKRPLVSLLTGVGFALVSFIIPFLVQQAILLWKF